jgi:hypothetical protein
MDGHSTHVALDVVKWAWKHRIIIFCLPAHMTAHLQPLDVGLFGPLKTSYKSGLNERERRFELISKQNFAE